MKVYTSLLLAALLTFGCQESDIESIEAEASDRILRFSASVETNPVSVRSIDYGWQKVDVDIHLDGKYTETPSSISNRSNKSSISSLSSRSSLSSISNTRSTAITGGVIPDGESVGVSAAKVPAGAWDLTIKPNYIYNAQLTRNGTEYVNSQLVYWPDQPLRFYAYYPYISSAGDKGITLSPPSQPGFPTLSFATAAEIANQIDLLACSTPIMTSVAKVNLTMRHALTRIGFSVRVGNITEPVEVTRIELHNIVNQGVQSFSSSNDITWNHLDYDNNTSTYVASTTNGALKSNFTLTEEYQEITTPEGYMLLIPQEIKAGRTLVVLRYTVDGYPKELKTMLPATTPGSAGEWTAGKTINYKITLSPEENEFVIIPGLVGSANSFILNSYSRSNDPTVDFINFSIPITRVNEYYGNPAYARFYGSQTGIFPDTHWGVEVIWMDMANLLDITKSTGIGDDPGNDPSQSATYRYRDVPDSILYNDRGRFKVRVRVNAEGNALVGIFKDSNTNGIKDPDEAYIWSWHLWVTRYNPNYFGLGNQATLPASAASGVWPVINGAVHRYTDIASPAEGTYNNALLGSQTVWKPSTGLYAGLVSMDRNLGAFSDGFPPLQDGQTDRPLGALYYQYGRKDPFLSKAYRYLANGTPENNEYLQNINTIRYSVQQLVATPWIFPYGPTGNRAAWATDLPTDEPCSWFDPTATFHTLSSTDKTLTALPPKSIFDPSPYGWRMPVNGTWSAMTLDNSPWINGMGRQFNFGNGSVNFPAYGFRVASTGQFSAIGLQGCLWSCSTSNDTAPTAVTGRDFFFLRAGNTSALFQQTAPGYTTDATSVRSIQDPANPYPLNKFP